MLTKKQIKDLPAGDYPNWKLMKMFPGQQGAGKSRASLDMIRKIKGYKLR